MLVYSGAGGSYNDSVTVWDIDRFTAYAINVEGFGLPYTEDRSCDPLALSPDNRYLVIGSAAIRVWDLQNLPAVFEDRLPLYRHEGPVSRIGCLYFIDNTTIETISSDGIQRWNLHTGELIDQ